MKNYLLALTVLGLAACASKQNYNEATNPPPPMETRTPAADNPVDYITENGTGAQATAHLDRCGGHDGLARLVRDADGKLYLNVSNIECASWATSKDGFQVHELDRTGGVTHGGRIAIDESVTGFRTIIIGSKNFISKYSENPNSTGATKGDLVQFYVKPKRVLLDLRYDWDGKMTQSLDNCQGTVEAKINPKDHSLAIVLREVQHCDFFKISSSNGHAIGDVKPLQERRDGSMGAGFTISPDDIKTGDNELQLSVYRPGGREDKIVLRVTGSHNPL